MVSEQSMEAENSVSNANRLPESINGGTSDLSNPNSPFYIGANENSGALLVTK